MNKKYVDKFNSLNSSGKTLKWGAAKKRGEEFEKLINDILEDEGILSHRSYRINKGVYEQIDGAIKVDNRVILLEVKWVESGIAASELYAFMGKVDNKFDGTIGLFLSRAELSDSVLLALHKGRRQRILAIHGEDVDLIFKNKLSFGDYLAEAIHEVSIRNASHLPIKKYLSRIQAKPKIQKASSLATTNVSSFITNSILDSSSTSLTIASSYTTLTESEKKAIFEFIVVQYPQFYEFRSTTDKGLQFSHPNAIKNANYFLEIFYDDDLDNKVNLELVKKYYNNLIIVSPQYYQREFFTNFFSIEFEKLDREEKVSISKKLLTKMRKVFGSYDSENELTEIIKPIWELLYEDVKSELKEIYLEFFVSSRADTFPQVSYAKWMLVNGIISRFEINKWLMKKVSEDFESYKELGLDRPYEHIAQNYIRLCSYLDVLEINWPAYVVSKFNE